GTALGTALGLRFRLLRLLTVRVCGRRLGVLKPTPVRFQSGQMGRLHRAPAAQSGMDIGDPETVPVKACVGRASTILRAQNARA
ncbi:MAG: hypothetical protein C5B58_15160, partial [Acidobacteria bacterium]